MATHSSTLELFHSKVKEKSLSCVQFFATPRTVAYQSPQSMGFSRQEYWNGLPFPSSVDLPDPGIKPGSPALQAAALPSEPPGKPPNIYLLCWVLVVACGLLVPQLGIKPGLPALEAQGSQLLDHQGSPWLE